jgi:hypothetical protein
MSDTELLATPRLPLLVSTTGSNITLISTKFVKKWASLLHFTHKVVGFPLSMVASATPWRDESS